jgi:O-antigen/teichoic acid export membrane protein
MLLVMPFVKMISMSLDNFCVVRSKTIILLFIRMSNSVMTILLIILAKILNLSFESFILIFVISEIFFAVISLYIIYKDIVYFTNKKNFKLIKKIINYSIPIGFASILGTLTIEIDKVMVSLIYNPDNVAIYTNASREMPVTVISASISAVLLPKLVVLLKNNKVNEALKTWKYSINLSIIILSFFSTVLFIFAPQVIEILYSSKYLEGINIFRIYSIILLLRVTYFGIVLNSLGKTKVIMYTSILTLFLNIILNIFLA